MGEGSIFDLSGKIALVTGAGQGAGEGIARMLARQGAKIIVNDIVEERAAMVADSISSAGGTAVAQPFDVTDLPAVREGMAAACNRMEASVDILINNAGNGGAGGLLKMMPFAQLPPEHWSAPINVNLYGVMNCTHVVLGGMIAKGWGRLITIASTAGTQGGHNLSHYGASKGGAIAFTRHMAIENAEHGITANSVALGLIRQTDTPTLNEMAAAIPVGRRGNPEDVAALVLYLASVESAWFTGQTLHMNGGKYTS